jgi:hypothetical protein
MHAPITENLITNIDKVILDVSAVGFGQIEVRSKGIPLVRMGFDPFLTAMCIV